MQAYAYRSLVYGEHAIQFAPGWGWQLVSARHRPVVLLIHLHVQRSAVDDLRMSPLRAGIHCRCSGTGCIALRLGSKDSTRSGSWTCSTCTGTRRYRVWRQSGVPSCPSHMHWARGLLGGSISKQDALPVLDGHHQELSPANSSSSLLLLPPASPLAQCSDLF